MGTLIGHWISGAMVPGGSERTAVVHNPASGEATAEVSLASADIVEQAIASARQASAAWRSVSQGRRAAILFEFRDLLYRNIDDLASVVVAEHGKTREDAVAETRRGLENVEFACGAPSLLKGGFTEQASTDVDVYSIRQPLGVVVGITPFNFPVMVPLWMAAIAIACGNAFVLKPSEKDPSASLILARLWHEAGLPNGVFNVVQGDAQAVEALLAHPDVAAISFVGSTPVARRVYEVSAKNGKRVQALGGAKNHMLVMPDADLDVAANAAVSAAFGAAGERCMAVSVVIAVGDAGERLVEAIASRAPLLRVGDGSVSGMDMGPLISEAHRDRVASYIGSGADSGAHVVVDGRDSAVGVSDGFYLGPSVIDHVKPGMSVYDDEIFGPVLSIVRVSTLDEAIALINSNPYGNGASIFTRNGSHARRFQYEVQAGMVGINIPIPTPVGYYSFGGWKSSLFGDTHIYGPEAVTFYTRGKVVTSRWAPSEESASSLNFAFPAAH